MNEIATPPTTSASAATPPREPRALRIVRSVLITGCALTLILVLLLFGIGRIPFIGAALEPVFGFQGSDIATAVFCTVAFVLLVVGTLGVLARRKGWLTWPVLGVCSAASAAVLGWLAWDEPSLRHPLSIDELSPTFPGAERSFAVLMRYAKPASTAEARTFATYKFKVPALAASPREPEKFIAFVTERRADLAADWAMLAAERKWLEQLNAFPQFGDLTPPRANADLISFPVWRALSQRASAEAMLLALDGRGDDAIATLVPILEAGRKLQVHSRTLVRSMVGIVIERLAVETASLVLDRTTPSAAARARLLAALGNDRASALARHLMLIEYAHFWPTLARLHLGDALGEVSSTSRFVRGTLNLLGRLVYNSTATSNLYGAHILELAALAEARELGKLEVRTRGFDYAMRREPGIKNVAGRLLLQKSIPAYTKVVDSFWKTADLRAALQKRLAASSP